MVTVGLLEGPRVLKMKAAEGSSIEGMSAPIRSSKKRVYFSGASMPMRSLGGRH